MPNKRRAQSVGDLILDPSDEESDSLLHCSTKSEGPNLNRRASQGCIRTIPIGYSRPDTPTRVLESSFRTSSPSLNRAPKSVRFKFPEQDHFEALALARKAKEVEVPLLPDPDIQQKVKEVTEALEENVTRLLSKESRLELQCETAGGQDNISRGYYFQITQTFAKDMQWSQGKTWLVISTVLLALSVVFLILLIVFIKLV